MRKHDPSHIELDKFWPYHAVVLADQISRYTHSIVKTEAGMNISQWRVLAAIADKPGRTAAEVTTITPMDKTIVSRAVNSLIESGLIQKSPDKNDKRRLSLHATQDGSEVYKKIARKLNDGMGSARLAQNEAQDFVEIVKKLSSKMRDISPKQD